MIQDDISVPCKAANSNYNELKALVAVSTVACISPIVWAAEMKAVSNWLGGR
jgi:hypothetical protein